MGRAQGIAHQFRYSRAGLLSQLWFPRQVFVQGLMFIARLLPVCF